MNHICYKVILHPPKTENHIRGLAKELNINQMTISRRIKELEDKNILDFKQEGKNKVYFIKETIESGEAIKIMEHLRLMDVVFRNGRFRRIVKQIKEIKKIKLAVLFGSYAREMEHKSSDIDVYVESKDNFLKKELELIDSKLSIKIGNFDKKSPLIREIIKNHIIIKGVDRYYELVR